MGCHVSSGCFSGKQWPQKKMQTATIKPTYGPPRDPELFTNQLECFYRARGRHSCKRKAIIWWWVANVMKKKWKLSGKQHSDLPLSLLKGWELLLLWHWLGTFIPFASAEEDRGKNKENKNHVSVTIFSIISMSSTYSCSAWYTLSWWGAEVFVKMMLSSKLFAYQYSSRALSADKGPLARL